MNEIAKDGNISKKKLKKEKKLFTLNNSMILENQIVSFKAY